MKVAVIDVGTNSTRLLIVDTIGPYRRDLYRSATITRLGEGVNKSRLLKQEAIERTLAILSGYAGVMRDFGVSKVRAIATSAARDATNAADFRAAFRKAIGFDIEIISGEQEAVLTFKGAVGLGRFDTDSNALVIDAGGGSTEFIWGRDGAMAGRASIDIGSVRLTEAYIKSDPPEHGEFEAVRSAVFEAISATLTKARNQGIDRIIAVAGTATTLAAIKHSLEIYDPEIVHGTLLSRNEIESMIARFRALPTVERSQIAGLQPGRADVILAGAMILQIALDIMGADELVISERDILDGIADSMLQPSE